MNEALLNKEVQNFLEKNYKTEVSKIAFKGSIFPEVSTQELTAQIFGKKKAEKKLSTWFKNRNIIYPGRVNLEQTSSEKTAEYKASLISGDSIVDLTGGFGIDAYYFGRNFQKVMHCELDRDLSEIVKHNFDVLGAKNVEFFTGDGIDFLENTSEVFDWIYVDPSRRSDTGGRVFQLSDCMPNVPENLDLLWEKGKNILLKTSPLLDLSAGIKELGNVKEIHVVAVENDVKELLWILKKDSSEEIKVKALNFQKKDMQIYESYFRKEASANIGPPLTYLYEPNAAVMKSGLFDALAENFELQKLHPNTQLFTSEKRVKFPGRRFRILKSLAFKKKLLKNEFSFEKAHITTRNFSESVALLRKKFGLKDGGEHYLFFTTGPKGEKLVLLCQKG